MIESKGIIEKILNHIKTNLQQNNIPSHAALIKKISSITKT